MRRTLGFAFALGAAASALAFGAEAPAVSSSPTAKPRGTLVTGSVTYLERDCYADPSRVRAPVADALLILDRPQGRASTSVRLDRNGHFAVRIGGRGPVRAILVLDGLRVRVTPNAEGALSYKLPLGTLEPQRENEIVLSGNAAAGAANVWRVLNEAAEFAAGISPVRLPKVTARWRYNADLGRGEDIEGSYYVSDENAIYVGGADEDRHEWERRILLHEYGHHLLLKVADPGPRSTSRHSLTGVYPDVPGLAWSEGFAHAFAAVALRTGLLKRGCRPSINLAATPAQPAPSNPRLAQYNETRAAGVLYHLLSLGGSGDREKGLKRLLGAVRRYRVDGHPPSRMREVRDALIVDGWEAGDPAKHLELTKLFARQGLAWGLFVQLFGQEWGSSNLSIELIVRGPYGTCTSASAARLPVLLSQEQSPGFVGADGGLPYTWQDECLVGADLPEPYPQASLVKEFDLHFPYLADQGHRKSLFTLSAIYRCFAEEDTPCSGELGAAFHVWNGQAVLDPEAMRGNEILSRQGLPERGEVTAPGGVALPLGSEVTLLRWGAAGNCAILVPREIDCSV